MKIMLDTMNVELTAEQQAALEEKHRLSRDHRVRDRIRCVLLSAQCGSTALIAQSQLIIEMNIIGMLNIIDIARTVTCEYLQINRDNIFRFFVATRQTYTASQKLYIIPDGASYHRLLNEYGTALFSALRPSLNRLKKCGR